MPSDASIPCTSSGEVSLRTSTTFSPLSAAAAGTPWLISPCSRLLGRDDESPTIIRLKKIPIETTWAEFWNVVFIPDPAPRCAGGRLFITPVRLGDPKAAMDSPEKKSRMAKTQ